MRSVDIVNLVTYARANHMIIGKRVAYFQSIESEHVPHLKQVERRLFRLAETDMIVGDIGGIQAFKVARQVVNSIGVWTSRNLMWFKDKPVRGPRDEDILHIAKTLRWPLLELSRHRDWLHPQSLVTINSSCKTD